eukprot:TRINITY_DN20365_c0_g1_i1.p2 TRINITY_DN20365_c0_g1~~TRINITY_DN20365_c0_g1_i1.p2  ORF type:complete len:121 (-),score=24.87 TRINITY_DN20365_c0_g1_i1:136-498(-)
MQQQPSLGTTPSDMQCLSSCPFRCTGGNTFRCMQHNGMHVCDQRCNFRELVPSDSHLVQYRCVVSGLVTSRRLLAPQSLAHKSPHKRQGQPEEAQPAYRSFAMESSQGEAPCNDVEMQGA